ncbi:tetratricopeptide repeat protein, partial [Flavobacteriaceae bacterium]|nr:tetratricopeptide repeat protein [Flavobacteriaceae bacterium]
MKNLIYICSALVMIATSSTAYAQKDSIALQREARKLVRAGNALYNQNNYGDASIVYKKALEKNSGYKKATYNLGNSLYQEKNFKEAIPQYTVAVENAKDPFQKAEGYHNIGNAMMQEKNYQGAVDAFKNALRSNPNDDETRYNLAVAQKLLEKDKNKDKNKDKDKDKDKDK